MQRFLASLLLALFCATAAAYPCGPGINSTTHDGYIIEHELSAAPGPFVLWGCYPKSDQVDLATDWTSLHCLEATWSEIDLRRLGDRIDTIRKAPDKLAAFVASVNRHRVDARSERCASIIQAFKATGSRP